eukprot:scaffold88926_cov27-Attheya_sp.AAC.1
MNIKRLDNPKAPLFQEACWAARSQRSSVIFFFAPVVRHQAQSMINALLPYCRHHYGDRMASCFQLSAVTEMMDVTWNATTNKAVSPRDAGLKKAMRRTR